jgi:hypothetical protein
MVAHPFSHNASVKGRSPGYGASLDDLSSLSEGLLDHAPTNA